jgi:diguanylate cyclase (GGDEF)-like protein/PAS domain S-box-containing protein
MNDTSKTNQDLIQENALLRQRISELEKSEADRKEMEEALKEEKETFYTVLENYPTGVSLIGSDGVYLYINPEFTRVTGYTIRDIPSGREWLRKAYPDPDYRKIVVDTWKRDLLSHAGSAVDREFTITRIDGETRVVNIRTTFTKNFAITGLNDVTERRRAEEALRESEEKFSKVFQCSSNLIAITEMSRGSIIDANDAWVRAFGYSRGEAVGRSAMELGIWPDKAQRARCLRQLEEEGRVVGFESILNTCSGKRRYLLAAEGIELGGERCAVWELRDITDRKEAEEALRRSEIKYRRIFESLEDVYYQTDKEGRIRIVSPSIKQAGGWSPEELIGRPATDVYVEPDQREGLLSILSEKGSVKDYDVALRKKDGTHIQASLSGRLLFDDDSGKPNGICGVLRDITDRKMAEEALQYETAFLDAVINCSQEGIYLLDAERHKVLENQRARDLWKMPQDADDDEARLLHMIRSLKDANPFREKLAYLHAHPEDSVHVELELKDGTVLDGHSSPISNKSGRNYGRLWTFRDITELRHNARMLEKLSATDALTSLANRRHFDDVLDQESQRALRNQSSIALLMIDIDLFKAYNDRYGHPMGDECLRLVASAITRAIHRPSDLSARYGGEEFACILPDTDLKGALVVAQKVLESVRALNIPHLSSTVAGCVTVSAGAAALIPVDGQPISQLIEMADMSLYQAKLAGRNQVRSARRQEGEN